MVHMHTYRRRFAVTVLSLLATHAAAAQTPGSLDTTFGAGGVYISPLGGGASEFGPGLAVQPDARIVVGGKSFNGRDDDIATFRLTRAGALDPSFGSGGSAVLTIGGLDENIKSVLLLPDGRILVGGAGSVSGYGKHLVVRYLADGRLDTTFAGVGGVAVDFGRPSHVHGMALQPDGKLVIAGEAYAGGELNAYAIARLTTTGALDASFGTGGLVQQAFGDASNAHAVAIAADGSILVGGYVVRATDGTASGFLVARFRPDGRLDTTFGTGGRVIVASGGGYTNYAHKLLVQSDGKIVVVGSRVKNPDADFMMVRLNANGALDTGFGSGGIVTTEFGGRSPVSREEASAGVLQADGKIVLGGSSEGKFALARYLTNGGLDTTFGSGGKVSFAVGDAADDDIKALAIDVDGRIVAAGIAKVGGSYRMAVARLVSGSAPLADIDRLFNWAEAVAPQYISPRGPTTQTIQGYEARLYANGNAIAARDGRLYLYGAEFGGLRDVGSVSSFLAQAIAAGY